MTQRDLEPGMKRDLTHEMTYSDYLQLDQLLNSQSPMSSPPHHDEMLFIIQHQTSELWLKLMVHELQAALGHIHADNLPPAFKILARVKHIQQLLFAQWTVLTTLTPSEYTQFRSTLGKSSGFQSVQYRNVEFLMGNKDRKMVGYHKHDPAVTKQLTSVLEAPSVYDAFLQYLGRQGMAVPQEVIDRDFSLPYVAHPGVVDVFHEIYTHPDKHWDAYNMCEKLVDLEEHFSLWRFRHMKVVARVIGFKRGTGGSSGVAFLRKMIDHEFFPELWQVRTIL